MDSPVSVRRPAPAELTARAMPKSDTGGRPRLRRLLSGFDVAVDHARFVGRMEVDGRHPPFAELALEAVAARESRDEAGGKVDHG